MDEPVGVDCYNMALTKDKAMTVGAAASDKNHVPCVIDKPEQTSFCIAGNVVDRNARQNGSGCSEECASTLNTTDRHAVATCFSDEADALLSARSTHSQMFLNPERNFVMETTYGIDRAAYNQGKNAKYDISIEENKAQAVVARGPGAVCECFSKTHRSSSAEDPTKWEHREVANTLNTNDNSDVRTNELVVGEEERKSVNQVRRLTPLECTRLQGFDDGWVDIGDWTDTKGKVHKESDSTKYKALGNSIALPFWQFLADRMVAILKRDGVENPKMCSLFDGIGAFPLSSPVPDVNRLGRARLKSSLLPWSKSILGTKTRD